MGNVGLSLCKVQANILSRLLKYGGKRIVFAYTLLWLSGSIAMKLGFSQALFCEYFSFSRKLHFLVNPEK
jgi:hypothetical protein